jgi:hypothetical protein
VNIDPDTGNLVLTLENGAELDAGRVLPDISIGTVTQGSAVAATITGTALSSVLNLVLPNATALGLGNVTNESKATMFASPTFTGTVSGVTATHVGLGNVTNESKGTMFTSPTFTGTTTLQQITEVMSPISGATGVVVHNFSTAAIFYHTSPAANFTINITNVPTTINRVTTVSLIITQGATGYYPTALQIGGVAQTINWIGNVIPTPSINRNDLVSFTLIRTAAPAWIVTGAITGY